MLGGERFYCPQASCLQQSPREVMRPLQPPSLPLEVKHIKVPTRQGLTAQCLSCVSQRPPGDVAETLHRGDKSPEEERRPESEAIFNVTVTIVLQIQPPRPPSAATTHPVGSPR